MKVNKIFMLLAISIMIIASGVSAMDISIDGCIKVNEKNTKYQSVVKITNNENTTLKLDRLVFDEYEYDYENSKWGDFVRTKNYKNLKVKKLDTRTLEPRGFKIDNKFRLFIIHGEDREVFTLDKNSKVCEEPKEVIKPKKSRSKVKLKFKHNKYDNFEKYSISTKNINKVDTIDKEIIGTSNKYLKNRKAIGFKDNSKVKGIKYLTENRNTFLSFRVYNDGTLEFTNSNIDKVLLNIGNEYILFNTDRKYKI